MKKIFIVVLYSLLLLSCRIIKPEQTNSYRKEDSTITNYKKVDVEYKGATVTGSFNYDSLVRLMADKYVKLLPVQQQQSINLDSLYKAFKANLKTNEKQTVTDPQTKVQLQYWVDEFGKLQMTCSSKDQTIQMMVAEITRLTKEVSTNKKTEIVYKMSWWGWAIVGCSLFIIIIALIIGVVIFLKYKSKILPV